MVLLFCSLLLTFPSHGPRAAEAFVGAYGINYGRIANNIPSPDKVVALLRSSKLRNVKIYDADHSVLDAFRGTGLNLVIAVNNGLLKDFAANESAAMDWLNDNVKPYLPQTRIVGITVGNEVLGGDPSLPNRSLELSRMCTMVSRNCICKTKSSFSHPTQKLCLLPPIRHLHAFSRKMSWCI